MKTLSEHKDTLGLVFVCILVTGGNIWLNRDTPPEWVFYEIYGIKFSHPKGLQVQIITPPDWNLGYYEGGLQAEPTSGETEIIGLYWTTGEVSTPEKAIDAIFEIGRQENPGLTRESTESMRIGDYIVAYAKINIEIEGMNVPGIVSAFRDPYGRMMIPYYLRYQSSAEYVEMIIKQLIRGMEFTPPETPRSSSTKWPTEEWSYATPAEVGLDVSGLHDMLDDIESRPSSIQVDSVVVVKDGYIVLEEYYNGYTETSPHIIYSCTKSIVSTIFGIAYERGEIPDLDTRLLDVFPDYNPDNLDERKESITLRDLLMMSGGFDARDSWLYEWEKLTDLHDAPDAVEYTLDLPMSFEPGSRFEYTNAVSHLLSCIITRYTGYSALEYGMIYLFEPLGINIDQWDADNHDRNWGYNRIYMTPRDMAKIGYLFLQEGMWDGEHIISSNWIEEATKHRIDANILEGYGYQWWVGDGFYAATGYQGQFIFVYPEYDLVVVYTGGTPETYDYLLRLPDRFIIPSLN